MQEFGPPYCNYMKIDQSMSLKDTRDNNSYTVAKLKDGRCWMIQNLRIQNATLHPNDSNVISDFVLPASSQPNTWSNTDYSNKKVYIDSNVAYGGYYNWPTATAGEGTYNKTSGNTSQSIYPKGWRLPTGNVGGEFEILAKAYGNGTDQSTSNALQASPIPAFSVGGLIYNSSVVSRGIDSTWLTSSALNNTIAYILSLFPNKVAPTNNNYKSAGGFVRCINDI